jgi:hypothetical protein
MEARVAMSGPCGRYKLAHWHECVIDGTAGITGVHKSMDLNFTHIEDVMVVCEDLFLMVEGLYWAGFTHPYPSL